jgi:flagellar hook-basal body complex protein FliE
MIEAIGAKGDPFKAFDVRFGQSLVQSLEFPQLKKMNPVEMGGEDTKDFMNLVSEALGEVSASKNKADAMAFDYATGGKVDVHNLMIQAAQADVLMQLTSSVVSKTAQGLNQLLQTQV